MSDLTEFLAARVDEDEEIAREAVPGPWVVISDIGDFNFTITGESNSVVVTSNDDGGIYEKRDAAHIARHDPARVLADVAATRRIIADLVNQKHMVCEGAWYTCGAATEADDGGECDNELRGPECDCGRDDRVNRHLRLLALPYAAHPDYRPEWAP